MAVVKLFAENDRTFESDGDKILQPISALVTEQKNADFYLEMETTTGDAIIVNQCKIVAVLYKESWQGFRVKYIENQGTYVYYKCYHVSNDAYDTVIKDELFDETKLKDAVNTLNNDCADASRVTVVTTETTPLSLEIHNNSLGDILLNIATNCGLVLQRDNYTITLVSETDSQFDNEVCIEYGKNLTSAIKYEDAGQLVTKLYPTMTIGDTEYSIDPLEDGTIYKNMYAKSVDFETSYPDYFDNLIADIEQNVSDREDLQSNIESLQSNIESYEDDKTDEESRLDEQIKEVQDLETYYRKVILSNESMRNSMYREIEQIYNQAKYITNKKIKLYTKKTDKLTKWIGNDTGNYNKLDAQYKIQNKKKYRQKAKATKKQMDKLRKKIQNNNSELRSEKSELKKFKKKLAKLEEYKEKCKSAADLSSSTINGIISILKDYGIEVAGNLAEDYVDANHIAEDKAEYKEKIRDAYKDIYETRARIDEIDNNISLANEQISDNNAAISELYDAYTDKLATLKADAEADLREQAEAYLNKYKYPQVSYEIMCFGTKVVPGEIIQIKNGFMGIDITTVVENVVTDVITQQNTSIEFGNLDTTMVDLQNAMQASIEDKIDQVKILAQNNYSRMLSNMSDIKGMVVGSQQQMLENGQVVDTESEVVISNSEISSKVSRTDAQSIAQSEIAQQAEQITSTVKNDVEREIAYDWVRSSKVYYASSKLVDTMPTEGWTEEYNNTGKYNWKKIVTDHYNNTLDVSGFGPLIGIRHPIGTDAYLFIRFCATNEASGTSLTMSPQDDTQFVGYAISKYNSEQEDSINYKFVDISTDAYKAGIQTDSNGYIHIMYSDDGLSFTENKVFGGFIGILVNNTAADSTTFTDYTWYRIKPEPADCTATDYEQNLTLLSSTQTVVYDADNNAVTTDLITFTAIMDNADTEIKWTADNGITLVGTGNARTLDPSTLGDFDSITVKVSANVFTDYVVVKKLTQSSTTYKTTLTNPYINIPGTQNTAQVYSRTVDIACFQGDVTKDLVINNVLDIPAGMTVDINSNSITINTTFRMHASFGKLEINYTVDSIDYTDTIEYFVNYSDTIGRTIIAEDEYFYVSSFDQIVAGSEWVGSITKVPADKYIWFKISTTFDDGTNIDTNPLLILNNKKGIISIIKYYSLSNDKINPPTTWYYAKDKPQWKPGFYTWYKIHIIYENYDSEDLTPICNSIWEAVNALQNNSAEFLSKLNQQANTIQTSVSSYEIKNDGKIASMQSLIDQTANKILLFVDADGNLCKIDMSANETTSNITLAADNIDLKGKVSADDIKIVDLTSLNATLAGWKIKGRYIYKDTEISGGYVRSQIEAPEKETNWFLSTRHGTVDDNGNWKNSYTPWYVDHTGGMHFSDIDGGNKVDIDSGYFLVTSTNNLGKIGFKFADGNMQIWNESAKNFWMSIGCDGLRVKDKNGNWVMYMNTIQYSGQSSTKFYKPCVFYDDIYLDNFDDDVFSAEHNGMVKDGSTTRIYGKWVRLSAWSKDDKFLGDVTVDGTAIYPESDSTVEVGKSNKNYTYGHFTNKLYCSECKTSSDLKNKENISTIDEEFAVQLVNLLNCVSFNFKADGVHSGKREQMGFVAQHLHELGMKLGKNLALYEAHIVGDDGTWSDYDDNMDVSDDKLDWQIDKTQLIAPIVTVEQKLLRENEELKAKVATLEEQMQKVIDKLGL